jgi:hypothetical protein
MAERLNLLSSQEVLMSIVYFLVAGLFFVICKAFIEFCENLRGDGQ